MEELGWDLPDTVQSIGLDKSLADAVSSALDALRSALEDDTATDSDYATVAAALVPLVVAIYDVSNKAQTVLDATWLAATDFAEKLPERLLDYVVVEYLRTQHPSLAELFIALGIVELQDFDAQSSTHTSVHTRRIVHWDRIVKAVTDPVGLLTDVYGWGTANADLELLIERLFGFAVMLLPAAELGHHDDATDATLASPAQPVEDETSPYRLRGAVVRLGPFGSEIEAGIEISPIPPASAGGAPGLAAGLYATGNVDDQIYLDDEQRWLLEIQTALDLSVGAAVAVRPGEVRFLMDLSGAAANASGRLSASITRQSEPGTQIQAFTVADGVGLTTEATYVKLLLGAGVSQAPEVAFEAGLKGGKLGLDMSDSDSFLAKLLPESLKEIDLDVALGYSSARGVYFVGSAELKFAFPMHLEIGPLELDEVDLTIGLGEDGLPITIAIAGGAELGPLQAAVEGVGLKLPITFPQGGGNLGPANIGVEFKPPDGVGLALDAGPVGGGGFILFDDVEKQYAGLLEVKVEPTFALTAIALVTTRMPDGSNGFSMLVIITVELPPIQLGFGFTLNKVGGLAGINRGTNVDALRAGLKDGTLDSIRFPHDVVANAPKIISDIRNAFPVAENTYVLGPMVGVGWGTPSLVTLELGLILELPSPLRLILLGKLALAVPDPDDAVVLLQIELLGILDFDAKEISFDGTLQDSKIVTFPLSGDMALRASYGSSPTFGMSAGGFHPRFQPPPNFPALDRMSLDLSTGDNPRIRLEAYFAVTSNSIQTGARLELYAEADFGIVGDFTVQGDLGFDVLIKFSPFSLVADMGAHLSLKRNGDDFASVSLTMTLEGPRPWHAWGEATFHALGSDHSIGFDVTIGPQDPPAPLPPADPEPDLLAALQVPSNWSAALPSGAGMLVGLIDRSSADDGVVLHPLGRVTVRQRVVPLDVQISNYGHQPLAGGSKTYSIASVSDDTGALDTSPVSDMFAAADFFPLSDDEKLSRPAFEPMDSGVEVTSDDLDTPLVRKTNFGYETIVIDHAETGQSRTADPAKLSAAAAAALAAQGPAARAKARTTGEARFGGPDKSVSLGEPRYAAASATTLSGAGASGGTYTKAAVDRDEARAAHPGNADDVQVVGAHEVLA